MKYGSVTLGQVEALINKLGGEETLRRILSGEVSVSIAETVKVASKLLKFVGTIMVPATKRFVAKNHFTTDSKVVKIGYLDGKFTSWFLGKTEEPKGKTELKYFRLKKSSLDEPILDELGSQAETTLSSIWELLKLQAHGEKGILLTNGYVNIFYVRDAKGLLRAVDINWNAPYGYWWVRAYLVDFPGYLGDGYRVFCNSQSA